MNSIYKKSVRPRPLRLLYAVATIFTPTCFMSDSQDLTLPATLDALLPQGMLTQGGLVAAAMAAVAQRKRAQPGWEAFHYERLSDTEFEITGGLVELQGGSKKWPGPHDTVLVSEAEVLQEMRAAVHTVPAAQPAQHAVRDAAATRGGTSQQILQVTLTLPEDAAARLKTLQAFHLQAKICGATVVACALRE